MRLIWLLLLFALLPLMSRGQVALSDSLAIRDFYSQTGGPNWLIKWDTSASINTYFGVTLSAKGTRVIGLSLPGNSLSGNLPINIGNLNELTTLNLFDNGLSDSIPASIGSIDSLLVLNLGENNLSDTIPNELTQLKYLRQLVLNDNMLQGKLPTNIGSLDSLRTLNLATNQFSGSLPSSLTNLDSLEILNLSNAGLEGGILSGIGAIRNLQELNLADNGFSGSILGNLIGLTRLKILDLSGNQLLVGSIPETVGNLKELTILDLSDNQFSGGIPKGIGNLSKLEDLALSTNQLQGALPDTLFTISTLQEIDLSSNSLGDTIYTEFVKLKNLRTLDVSSNRFSVMENLSGLAAGNELLSVNVSDNRLSFEDLEPNISILPDALLYQSQAEIDEEITVAVFLQGDSVITTTTGGANNRYRWFRNGERVSNFSSDNTFKFVGFQEANEGVYTCEVTNLVVTGLTLKRRPVEVVTAVSRSDRAALTALYKASNGPDWLLQWDTTDVVSKWHGVIIDGGRVTTLNLANNLLNGTIPKEIESLSVLEELRLNNNQLTDTIPDEIGKLSALQVLTLNNNSFRGDIPNVSALVELLVLDLSENNLTGDIPSVIGDLEKLAQLDLSNNNLDGAIDSGFGDLKNLRELDLSGNDLTGSIPTNLSNLSQLVILDLSENELGGSIFSSFSALNELTNLDLSQNNLTGGIPTGIGELPKLVELNLSDNPLGGTIPTSFADLINLLLLDLSNTEIDGDVPTRFNSLNKVSRILLDENRLSGLPDLSSLGSLDQLSIKGNELTFEDIVPNLSLASRGVFDFSEQLTDRLVSGDTLQLSEDLSLEVVIGGSENVYKWSKDGVPISAEDPGITQLDQILERSNADYDFLGDYRCTVTNNLLEAAGFSLSFNFDFRVEVQPLSPLINAPKPYCLGDTIVTLSVIGNEAPGVLWFGDRDRKDTLGTESILRTIITEPIDTVFAINRAGNLNSSEVPITIKIRPEVTRQGDSLIATGDGDFYQWFENGAIIPDEMDSVYILPDPETMSEFTVRISKDGCSARSIAASPEDFILEVNTLGNESVIVYPNPASDWLMLGRAKDSIEAKKAIVYNLQGVQVMEVIITSSHIKPHAINVSSLRAGLYLLQIISEDEVVQRRFIIDR